MHVIIVPCSFTSPIAVHIFKILAYGLYLPQVASLTVLHCQQWQVIGGHKFLHSLWNLSGCNHIDMVQPERAKTRTSVREAAQYTSFVHFYCMN